MAVWLYAPMTMSAQESPLTVLDCISEALQYNYTLAQAKNQASLNSSNVNAALGRMLPQASSNAGTYWNTGLVIDPVTNEVRREPLNTASASLGMSFNLFDGGRSLNGYRQAKVQAQINLENVTASEHDVILNTATNYLSALVAEEALDVARTQRAQSEQQLQRMQDMMDAGALSQADLLQTKAQVARDIQREVAARAQVDMAYLTLANGMGRSIVDFEIQEELIGMTTEPSASLAYLPEALFEWSKAKQPSIRVANLQVESALLGVKQARASLLPSLSFSGQLSTSYSDRAMRQTGSVVMPVEVGYWIDGNGNPVPVLTDYSVPTFEKTPLESQLSDNVRQFVGFNLSIPLFNGFALRNQVQQSKVVVSNAELQLKQTEDVLRQNITRSQLDAISAWRMLSAAELAAEAAEASLENAQVRREQGLISAFEFNSIQDTYLSAKSEAIRAKYDAIFKNYILEFLMNPVQLESLRP